MKRRPTFTPSEHQEQCAVVSWAEISAHMYPALSKLHAIPNGGLRHKRVAIKLKAEGVKPGVPDLCLPVSRCGYHGLYIEMKSKTGRPTKDQKEWISDLTSEGYLAVVCKGAEQAIDLLQSYVRGHIPNNTKIGGINK